MLLTIVANPSVTGGSASSFQPQEHQKQLLFYGRNADASNNLAINPRFSFAQTALIQSSAAR